MSRRIWYLYPPFTWWPAAILCSCPLCWSLMKSPAGVRLKVRLQLNTVKKTKPEALFGFSWLNTHLFFFVISEALVSLLLCLVKKCPTVCNSNHFVVLLGAYGVTLSTTGKTGTSVFVSVCLLSFFPLTSCFGLQIRNSYCSSRNMKETMSAC